MKGPWIGWQGAILTFLLLVPGPVAFTISGAGSGDTEWIAVLPPDFSSEFPGTVSIRGGAVNGSGDIADLIWNQTSGPAPVNMSESEMWLNFTPSTPGVYSFELRILDDHDNLSSPTLINVTVIPNLPPEVLPHNSTLTLNEDDDLEVDVSEWVEDPDEEISFSVNNSGHHLSINPLGLGSFQVVPEKDVSGEFDISFGATDDFNNTVILPAVVIIVPVPDPPRFDTLNGEKILVGTQDMEAYEDQGSWFNFTIVDPDLEWGGDSLTLTSDSARIHINGTSGWFTPTQEDVGSMMIDFQVRDSFGLTDNVSIVLDIINVNDDPVLVVNGMEDTVEAGTELNINFTGSLDPDHDTLSFFVRRDGGEWIQTQGFLVLNFDTIGTHHVEFKVDDGNGGVMVENHTVTVVAVLVPGDDDDENDDSASGNTGNGTSTVSKVDPLFYILLVPIVILVMLLTLLLALTLKGRRKEDDIWEWEE